jgi:hypothetical protein
MVYRVKPGRFGLVKLPGKHRLDGTDNGEPEIPAGPLDQKESLRKMNDFASAFDKCPQMSSWVHTFQN